MKNLLNSWERLTSSSIIKVLFPILVSIYLVLSLGFIRFTDDTFDERYHVTRGVMLMRTGDFRINQHHPILFNMIHSLPLAIDENFNMPETDGNQLWVNADKSRLSNQTIELNGGEDYFYKEIMPARFMAIASSLILLGISMILMAERFGSTKAFLISFIIMFSPTVIAHSAVVTTDIPIMWTLLIAGLCIDRFIQAPSKVNHGYMLLAVLVAILTKYTAVMLIPLALVYAYWITSNKKFIIITPFLLALSLFAIYGFQFGSVIDMYYERTDIINLIYD